MLLASQDFFSEVKTACFVSCNYCRIAHHKVSSWEIINQGLCALPLMLWKVAWISVKAKDIWWDCVVGKQSFRKMSVRTCHLVKERAGLHPGCVLLGSTRLMMWIHISRWKGWCYLSLICLVFHSNLKSYFGLVFISPYALQLWCSPTYIQNTCGMSQPSGPPLDWFFKSTTFTSAVFAFWKEDSSVGIKHPIICRVFSFHLAWMR